MEMILARRGIIRSSRKLRIYGPRYLCVSSQSYARGELRKNRAADNSRNGVVGNMGRKIPITPSIKDKEPMNKYIYFMAQRYGLYTLHQEFILEKHLSSHIRTRIIPIAG